MKRLAMTLCGLLALGCGDQATRPDPAAVDAQARPAGWCRDGRPTALARQAIAMLRAAGDQGLLPFDYAAEALAASMLRLAAAPTPEQEEALRFGRAIGAALERYLTDVHRGRVDPRQSGFDYHPGERHRISELIAGALEKRDLASALAEAEPAYPQYQRLKAALARYRALAAEGPAPPLPGVRRLSPGDVYSGLPLLAARLRALGDLPHGMPAAGDRYEGALVQAVRHFQARHGLAADGILDPATLDRLDMPHARRVRQIELALERLRWLPHAPSRRLLVVNVPAFRLLAFDRAASDAPVLESAVVVGEAARQRTPFFIDAVRSVVFRPSWYPTRGIIEREILPALRRDPGYLARQRLELVARGADDTPALPPTEENLERLAAGSLLVRQRPGPHNALGLVKFGFPNRYDVYLHDTPEKELFAHARRDFSHGCIRVQKPAELAAFLLAGTPEWTEETIRATMDGPRTLQVELPEPVPVFIYYTTAIVRRDGTSEFFDDLYGLDATLDATLRAARSGAP